MNLMKQALLVASDILVVNTAANEFELNVSKVGIYGELHCTYMCNICMLQY